MQRLSHTLRNMVNPDPTKDAEVGTILEEIKNPWKRADWITLAILSLIVAAAIALTGCGKQMSGVYEVDMAQTMAQMGLSQPQGMPNMGGMSRIAFDGDRVVVQMGMMEIRGSYKVKDDAILVTAEGYGPNGQFPLYIIDDNTIKFQGAVYRRKQ